MLLPAALILLGSLLLYAGLKGLSIQNLLLGDNSVPSSAVKGPLVP